MKNQSYVTVTKVFLTLVAFGHLNSWYIKVFFPLNNGLPLVMIIIVETKSLRDFIFFIKYPLKVTRYS